MIEKNKSISTLKTYMDIAKQRSLLTVMSHFNFYTLIQYAILVLRIIKKASSLTIFMGHIFMGHIFMGHILRLKLSFIFMGHILRLKLSFIAASRYRSASTNNSNRNFLAAEMWK